MRCLQNSWAQFVDSYFNTTPESQAIELFSEQDILWDELAFHVVKQVLQDYFADRKKGVFTPKHHVFDRRPT